MEEHLLGVDPWMKEAQEASNIIEDLENKWRSSMDDEQTSPAAPAASADQFKLVEVGIKLDRLESLLHNPPSKPILYNSVEESVDASEFSRSIESHEQGRSRGGKGIYVLYEDVKSCPCEDVHVLWSILVENQLPSSSSSIPCLE
ncbi:hypothetical protein LINPERHAP1_LOCUS7879 [Linum perenne]